MIRSSRQVINVRSVDDSMSSVFDFDVGVLDELAPFGELGIDKGRIFGPATDVCLAPQPGEIDLGAEQRPRRGGVAQDA
jgi:hypothetical protein